MTDLIEKIQIDIPDNVDKLNIVEKIIKICETSGCNVKVNPHTKAKQEPVLNEQQRVEQILGIEAYPKPE